MKTIVVTGANRGIGHEVARMLAESDENRVIACARSGHEAMGKSLGCEGAKLDVTDDADVAALKALAGPVDVLINNAGVMFQSALTRDMAETTLAVNLFGTERVTRGLDLKSDAVVVNVSSGMGEVGSEYAPEIKARILGANSLDDVHTLASEFLSALGPPFRSSAYAVSKALLNALTRVDAAEHPARRVNAVCPGWVQTRMGGASAPRTVEQGAKSVLATMHIGGSGGFYRDGEAIAF